MDERDLIYDWNEHGERWEVPPFRIQFDDETLRDGLQSPSVLTPTIEQKVELLHLMEKLGIDTADIGLPGAGPHVVRDVTVLAQEIVSAKLKIRANCAARTMVRDIQPVVDVSQKVGLPIEVCTFIGSSPIRQYAENWTDDVMLQHTREAVTFAVENGLDVMYVTEDTVRAHPETLRALFLTAIECGAKRLCLCDTVGHATPSGADAVVRFIRGMVEESGKPIGVDWHGHRDRDLAVANSIAAHLAGADRIHGSMLGIGERVGNTPIDTLMVNFKLMGLFDHDLTSLPAYARKVSQACRVSIPDNYPVLGRDAFRTQTGVHADAIVKAYRKGNAWLANRIYSGVPADELGLEQVIEVGPMSGKSNVRYWLESRRIDATDGLVERIFERAKQADHILTDEEIRAIVRSNAAGS